MEIQLQELIDQIKKDGVASAEAQAAEILANAKAEADGIVAQAKKDADAMILAAKAENERMTRASEDAIRQAGRNLLISFRESVNRELTALIEEGVTGVYSSEAFAGLLVNAVEAWAKNNHADSLTVLLKEQDLDALKTTLLAGLKAKMLTGVILKPSDDFDGGFRIVEQGGGAYYDYSAQAVVDMLSAYLSPRVSALMREAQEQ